MNRFPFWISLITPNDCLTTSVLLTEIVERKREKVCAFRETQSKVTREGGAEPVSIEGVDFCMNATFNLNNEYTLVSGKSSCLVSIHLSFRVGKSA